jgi:hypothetical protein
LIDAASGKLLARAGCTYTTENDPSPPDYDTLIEPDTSFLKAKLAAGADYCIGVFEKAILAP